MRRALLDKSYIDVNSIPNISTKFHNDNAQVVRSIHLNADHLPRGSVRQTETNINHNHRRVSLPELDIHINLEYIKYKIFFRNIIIDPIIQLQSIECLVTPPRSIRRPTPAMIESINYPFGNWLHLWIVRFIDVIFEWIPENMGNTIVPMKPSFDFKN